ncbi:cobalt-precorrin-5B (C(1))-methyltransferase CbiD [Clostridium nigeriense]|uniref:cobalt-precorrin-5B (C(1))-methyltransferase CbiD n=1 Tax=Clostridium nigeriense TaxID=1805470 RepID=UPI003D354B5E
MLDLYVESGGKKLRCGYTTGSTATAAAKAAAYMLFNNVDLDYIDIYTPKGIKLNVKINSIERGENYVKASVIKDGGDDIDATDGIEIFAKAEIGKEKFNLTGGIGVGIVTKEGLAIEPGEYAINPVPRKMIKKEVLSITPENLGVKISISVPEGVKVAEKTFNPRLGIVGGISILGTTGIVYPMSEDALKESIKIEITQKSIKSKRLVITFGNMGERCAKSLGFKEEEIVIASNFIGFAIESCIGAKVKEIVLVGHIGKISKVAYGCFNTHSRVNDVRLEVIGLELALLGYDIDFVKEVLKQKTSEGAVDFLGEGYEELYRVIGRKIVERMKIYSYDELKCDAIMYYGFRDCKVLYNSLEEI